MSNTVLHVSEATGWTGGLARMLELCQALSRRGWRVIVACRPGSLLEAEARGRGLRAVTLPLAQDYDLLSARTLQRLIVDEEVDLVHAHHPKAHAICLVAKALLCTFDPDGRRPALVVSRRVSYKVGGNPFSRWKYRSSLIDTHLAVAGAVKDILVGAGVEADRVAVVPSGLDPAAFEPRVPSAEFRQSLGLRPGAPAVGKIANASVAKGVAVFLDAARKLSQARPDVRFLLAGRDTDSAWVREAVEERGLSDKTSLLGFRRDAADVLSCLDVSVNAAIEGEALSGAMRESLALGVPVAASDIAGNRELVRHGETGLLFPKGDAEALASAVLRLLADRPKALAMAGAGRALVLSEFTTERGVEKTVRAYYDALWRAGILKERVP